MTVTALVAAALAFTLLRPDPLFFVAPLPADHDGPIPLRELFGVTKIRLAVVALVTGQAVMVLIMTMTPVHIRGAGEGLGIVGLVIGAHTFGMFALSPLSGRRGDHLGRIPVIVMGEAVAHRVGTDGRVRRWRPTVALGGVAVSCWAWAGTLASSTERSSHGGRAGRGCSAPPGRGRHACVVHVCRNKCLLGTDHGGGYALICVTGAALVLVPIAAFARLRPLAQPAAA